MGPPGHPGKKKNLACFLGCLSRKAEREKQKQAEEAKLARAYDTGRRTSDVVTKLIDNFFDEKVVPVARKISSAFDRQMEGFHHDKNTDDAMAALLDYSADFRT